METQTNESEDSIGLDLLQQSEEEIAKTFYKEKRKDYITEVSINNQHHLGEHPLWANYIWNASKCVAELFVEQPKLVQNKRIFELGAASGLPSITAALCNASFVVATDYPDKELIQTIQDNIDTNITNETQHANIVAQGYAWGGPKNQLPENYLHSFDMVIMSDLVFNHSKHEALLDACDDYLKQNDEEAMVLVAFTHHRPWRAQDDLQILNVAKEHGYKVEHWFDKRFPPMFPNDPGDVEVRSIVHVYTFKKNK